MWQRVLRTRSNLDRLDRIREPVTGFAGLPGVTAHVLLEWRNAHGEYAAIEKQIESPLCGRIALGRRKSPLWRLTNDIVGGGVDIDALRERLGAIRKGQEDLPR